MAFIVPQKFPGRRIPSSSTRQKARPEDFEAGNIGVPLPFRGFPMPEVKEEKKQIVESPVAPSFPSPPLPAMKPRTIPLPPTRLPAMAHSRSSTPVATEPVPSPPPPPTPSAVTKLKVDSTPEPPPVIEPEPLPPPLPSVIPESKPQPVPPATAPTQIEEPEPSPSPSSPVKEVELPVERSKSEPTTPEPSPVPETKQEPELVTNLEPAPAPKPEPAPVPEPAPEPAATPAAEPVAEPITPSPVPEAEPEPVPTPVPPEPTLPEPKIVAPEISAPPEPSVMMIESPPIVPDIGTATVKRKSSSASKPIVDLPANLALLTIPFFSLFLGRQVLALRDEKKKELEQEIKEKVELREKEIASSNGTLIVRPIQFLSQEKLFRVHTIVPYTNFLFIVF
jgi:hypothetical protein